MVFDTARLAAFVAVARAGGFSKAAKQLGKTQPSVSQAVLLLEREVGQQLFERDGHTPRLTEAGRVLLVRAERIFAEMSRAETELSRLEALEFGEPLLGTSDTLACYFLPPIFAAFRARYPKIELRIDNRPSPVIAERVSAREVDLGIISLPLPSTLEVSGRPVQERLDCVVLAEQVDVAVCHPQHPLASLGRVGVRELAQHPLLLLDRTTSSRALVELAFAAQRTELSPAMEMSSVEVLKRLAELEFGVAIVPRFSVERELESGALAALELSEFGPARSVGALTARGAETRRAASAFLELALAHSKPRRSSSSSLSE